MHSGKKFILRKATFIYGCSPFSTRLRSTRTLCNLKSFEINWPAEEEFLLTKAYYVSYGCQATILKANEKLNEEERARGRGREERVNLYFPLLPFPFLYFKPVVLSLESFIALPQLFINLGEHYSQEKCHHSHCKIHLLCRQGCF